MYDSIINKTPLSARTNQMIGGRAPSAYLDTMEKKADIGTDRMDEILRSHVIEPSLLRSDDFQRFFEKRAHALLDRIEAATGTKVSREQIQSFFDAETEAIDEEEEEWSDIGPADA